jgi:pimeloyl-ACP methyl ester carboxylesterase
MKLSFELKSTLLVLPLLLVAPNAEAVPRQRVDISGIKAVVSTVECPKNFPNAQCGTIQVPLDYSNPSGRQIKVGFAQYKAKNPQSNRRRAFQILNGGPGDSFKQSSNEDQVAPFQMLLPDHDILLIDPRGVGFSDEFSCPGFRPSIANIIDAKSTKACSDAVGRDSVHYTSANTVHDFALIVKALKYTEIDLLGLSYGTFLGITYAALHPERLRTLTLDGAFPVNNFDSPTYYAASRRLFDSLCARSGTCNGKQAWAALGSVATQLRAAPRKIMVSNLENPKQKISVTFDLSMLAGIVSSVPTFGENPERPTVYAPNIAAILAASRGNWKPLEEIASALYEPPPGLSQAQLSQLAGPAGLYQSIVCNDYRVPWKRNDSLKARLSALSKYEASQPPNSFSPFSAREWNRFVSAQNTQLTCLNWQPTEPNPAEDPTQSKYVFPAQLPVLVINGDLDIQTPIEGAKAAAAQFRNSRLLRTRYDGHIIINKNQCAIEAFAEFVTSKNLVNPNRCLESNKKAVVIGAEPKK